MRSLRLVATRGALIVVASIYAVHVAVIAVAAQVKHPATAVDNALNLPQIVHSRT